MTTAVLEEPKHYDIGTLSPMDRLRQTRPSAGRPLDLADNAPRYFVEFGYRKFVVDTECIPGRLLRRGEITPCLGYEKWAIIESIPAEMRIKGRTRTINRATEGCYPIYADAESTRLKDIEARNSDGMYCLELLTGFDVRTDFETCHFNDVFYPMGVENIPATHKGVIQLLEQKRDQILTGDVSVPRQDLHKLYVSVANALIDAARYADRLQSQQLEETHLRMRLASNDDKHKDRYDPKDEEMLVRTGKTRFDKHADVTADALTLLAQNAGKPSGNDQLVASMMELVKAQQEQNTLLKQQIEQATGSTLQGKTPAVVVEPPKPQPPTNPQPSNQQKR